MKRLQRIEDEYGPTATYRSISSRNKTGYTTYPYGPRCSSTAVRAIANRYATASLIQNGESPGFLCLPMPGARRPSTILVAMTAAGGEKKRKDEQEPTRSQSRRRVRPAEWAPSTSVREPKALSRIGVGPWMPYTGRFFGRGARR